MEKERVIDCDVLVIGGGINGAGIARDAAGRGLSVVLCEKDDLASHTSSASTKLIHGGLRYLEHYEFGLVRKSLIEREVLLRAAPHLIRPMRFIMPHDRGQRPAWLIRAGLMLYDHLARRQLLAGSHGVNLRTHPGGVPLKPEFSRGFVYSDGWVDDARLVVVNAIDAAERGARILTRTRCVSARPNDTHWLASLQPAIGPSIEVKTRCIVNAAGPWTTEFLQAAAHHPARRHLRLIKGSHIVVKRLFDHPFAYIFQHPDGRIVFAIPYEGDFTLIGTTDLDFRGDPNEVSIDANEIDYLCELSSRYFSVPVKAADVIWSFSGVRPLLEDDATRASAVTRDYRFELDGGKLPMLSVFGGKLTTFRKLAEEAVDKIAGLLSNQHGPWTETACLPGGDLFSAKPENRSVLEFDLYVRDMVENYSWLPAKVVSRYARAYGSRIRILLAGRNTLAEMGEQILPGLFAAEVDYLLQNEWASTAEDILWRRTKMGLHLSSDAARTLASWIGTRGAK
ncbi:glycerol-3-phosphate dehydrogenase [soil metagenome]